MTFLRAFHKIPTHLIVTVSGWTGRGLDAVAFLVAIPVLLSYLGTDQYAVWALLTSLIVWFNLVEFGLGPSLQNFLSEAQAKNATRLEMLNGSRVLIVILLLLAVGVWAIAYRPVDAFLFRKLPSGLSSHSHSLTGLVGLLFIVTVLASVSYRIFYARHQGYLTHILQGLSRLTSLAGILLCSALYSGNNKLTWCVLLWIIPPALCSLGGFLRFYGRIGLRFTAVSADCLRTLTMRCYKFAGFAALYAAALNTDYLVMSQTLNADSIATYNVLSKIFSFLLVLYWAMLMAIWPELSEMFSRGEWDRATRLLRRNQIAGALIIGAGTTGLVCLAPFIFSKCFPQSRLMISQTSIILFGLLFLVRAWSDTYATALMSLNRLRILWISLAIQGVLSLGGQYFLSIEYGLNGIVLGLMASHLLTVVWILPREFHRLRRERSPESPRVENSGVFSDGSEPRVA